MNAGNADSFLRATVLTVNGWGLALIGLAVIVIIPFFIAKRPAPAELEEGCFDAANRLIGNVAWWLIFITASVVTDWRLSWRACGLWTEHADATPQDGGSTMLRPLLGDFIG